MRVADYIFKTLADKGVRHCFLVTGGGAMQLNDALRLEKRIKPVCCHHEQACAIAAEGYYRASGWLPVVSVTTGPGGTNALTGVIGAWLDSIPMIVISGQVKYLTTTASCPEIPLRQLGDQEINIIDIVRPVTKYAKMVTEPNQICCELEKAISIATSGRPGPVWLDVPLNVQGAQLDERELVCDNHRDLLCERQNAYVDIDASVFMEFVDLLSKSKRPLIVAGHGIELDDAIDPFISLVEAKKIPVVTTFCGMNVLPTEYYLNFGRIGTLGQRGANFVLQSSDLIITIGTRNNIRQVSYNWANYAKRARKIVVDIDGAELRKPTIKPDLALNCCAKAFIAKWADNQVSCDRPRWIEWCKERKSRYPAHTPDQELCDHGVNPYHFMHVLTQVCPASTTIVAGNGTACVALYQTGIAKKGQRLFWNSGCASMGYDVPAALGAAFATGNEVVCLAGDGSAMMNVQELATIVYHNLPIKIFLLDNGGYCSIRQTQTNLFGPELLGCSPASGLAMPDFLSIGKAFGLQSCEIDSHENLSSAITSVLRKAGPVLCVIRIPETINFSPKLAARRLDDGTMISPSLEDMSPFLPEEEVHENLIYNEEGV